MAIVFCACRHDDMAMQASKKRKIDFLMQLV